MFTAIRAFLLGLVVGLLFTPRSGRANRQMLMERFAQLRSGATQEASRRFEEVRPEIQARLARWREEAEATMERLQRQAGEQVSQARSDLPGRLRELRETVPRRAVVIRNVIRDEVSERLGRRPAAGEARRREGEEPSSTETGNGQPRRGRSRQPRETEQTP